MLVVSNVPTLSTYGANDSGSSFYNNSRRAVTLYTNNGYAGQERTLGPGPWALAKNSGRRPPASTTRSPRSSSADPITGRAERHPPGPAHASADTAGHSTTQTHVTGVVGSGHAKTCLVRRGNSPTRSRFEDGARPSRPLTGGLLRSWTAVAPFRARPAPAMGAEEFDFSARRQLYRAVAALMLPNAVPSRVGQVPDPRVRDPHSSAVIQPPRALRQRGSHSLAVLYGMRFGPKL
ncbi:peptidase inhibitor family I36 protein [Streptomyces tsukubensis]|uniref:peptidase inhibitor family I36 protein n=1 Tax=Streptomyces tsukubensis TaxID=83656 RepID=UPI00386AA551